MIRAVLRVRESYASLMSFRRGATITSPSHPLIPERRHQVESACVSQSRLAPGIPDESPIPRTSQRQNIDEDSLVPQTFRQYLGGFHLPFVHGDSVCWLLKSMSILKNNIYERTQINQIKKYQTDVLHNFEMESTPGSYESGLLSACFIQAALPGLRHKINAMQPLNVCKENLYRNNSNASSILNQFSSSPKYIGFGTQGPLGIWKAGNSFTVQKRGMASLRQMHRTGLHVKVRPERRPLGGKPMLKGVVLKTLIKKPRKPNSANRKCVLVRLSNGKEAVAYVPGIGHNLQEHNIVLVRVGRLQDVPGVKLKCIRGVYDLPHVIKPSQG